MTITNLKFLKPLLILGCFCCSLSVYAQGGPPAVNGQTLTVTSTGSLGFGKFSRQNGGTITIDPFGTVSATGDIFLLNSLRSKVTFDLSTNRANTNMVTVTASPTPLTSLNGSLDLLVIFDKNSFFIDKNNPATVNMGGTLTVGPEDLPGYYTGTVTVTFAYQ